MKPMDLYVKLVFLLQEERLQVAASAQAHEKSNVGEVSGILVFCGGGLLSLLLLKILCVYTSCMYYVVLIFFLSNRLKPGDSLLWSQSLETLLRSKCK